ncbi:MAG: sensor histidine kinase [Vicinamibacterales bacterium]
MTRRRGFSGAGPRPAAGILAFATGLSIATVALVWLAWTATGEMRRTTALLLERRASEVLAFTSAALDRDMKGAWLSFLVPLDLTTIREEPPYDLLQNFSRAFARFPYPESFLIWTDTSERTGRSYAFTRADRPPPWQPAGTDVEPYPVRLVADPAPLQPLIARILDAAPHHRRFALVEAEIAGTPYQAVVHFMFSAPGSDRLAGFAAFVVNLDWVHREYPGELLRQVATIDGAEDAMVVTVLDEQGHVVGTSGGDPAEAPARERRFPLLFLEPALLPMLSAGAPPVREWTARVAPSREMARSATALGAQMLLVASLAGLASLVAMLLTVRAVRVSTELATMKSEFVSAVTHELKTPLALFKLVGDTLARGRYTSPETIRDYAAILTQEERRLSHLIENLLTYSRLSDLRQAYVPEVLDLSDLVEDALEPFRLRLNELGFRVNVAVSHDLPPVRADRVGLLQVFENLVDNAIKYSPDERVLTIDGTTEGFMVALTFTDAGTGIPADELPRVFEKFYRGRSATESGSGLGLAIVRRIVEQHGGTVTIGRAATGGTAVKVCLPAQERT